MMLAKKQGKLRRKKNTKKDIISLPKMKIIVKSTKTISFDGYSEESSNSSRDHANAITK